MPSDLPVPAATPDGRVLELVRLRLEESARIKQRLAALHREDVAAAAVLFADTVERGGTVLLCGNGGSAADAQHIAAELTGRFVHDRRPLAAVALTTDTSALTAVGNDYGYDHVFERQVRALGRPGDLLIALSTSGRSRNVVLAAEAARAAGMRTIGLTGGDGGLLAAAVDVPVVVPTATTARIQEAHIAVGHLLCEVMEERLFDRVREPAEAPPGLLGLADLLRLRERWRRRGATVVWTNGCFDLLHVGHVRSLRAARSLGDVLVVGLNDDDSVRRLKGPGRPLVPLAERAELLAELSDVDAVVAFAEDTPVEILSRVRPDIACKGADYAGVPLPEDPVVQSYGGRIELLPLVPDRSTTRLRDALREGRPAADAEPVGGSLEPSPGPTRLPHPAEPPPATQPPRERGVDPVPEPFLDPLPLDPLPLDPLMEILEGFSGRRILVVGDVMLDEYLQGRVARVSPEAPVPVMELRARSDAAGGAGNAAANIAGLGGHAELAALVGEDANGERLRTALALAGVGFGGAVTQAGRPTTTKTRVVAGQQQIARIDVEEDGPIGSPAAERLLRWFRQACEGAHSVLLCDYRKGVLTPGLCSRLIAHASERGLPVVVDPKGSDYGKYRGATVITPNVAEAEAATRHLRPAPEDALAAAEALLGELGGAAVLLTRGPQGMTLFAPGVAPMSVPADTQRVFDVTGAGDTVVAVLALALAAGASLESSTRLANLAAGLVVARPGTTALQTDELRAAVKGTR